MACAACFHAGGMSRMIRARTLPDDLRRRFEARAAMAGMPLSDDRLGEIRRVGEVDRENCRAALADLADFP